MKKIIIIIIVFLFITNISALITIINRSGLLPREEESIENLMQSTLVEQLGVNESQAAEITDIRASFENELVNAEMALNERQNELFTLISSENPDENEINNVIDRISLLQGQLQKEAVKRMIEEKNLLNTNQQQRYFSRFQTRMGRASFSGGKGLGYGREQGRGLGRGRGTRWLKED